MNKNKIKLEEIEKHNDLAIENYLYNNQLPRLNEYFYIQEPQIISNLLESIKYKGTYDNTNFLCGFFWRWDLTLELESYSNETKLNNKKKKEYQIAENFGNFFLRLEGYEHEDRFIEIKQLSIQEKFNYVKNLNEICQSNTYLVNMWELKNKNLAQRMIELSEDGENMKKMNAIYCENWIDKHDMAEVINQGVKFLQRVDLLVKLEENLIEKKPIKRVKI